MEIHVVKKYIFVTLQKEGIHCYPAAATTPELADVAYLAHPHRHVFHFKVWISVTHDDRDIEFIQFKNWIYRLYGLSSILSLDNQSCEMIADNLLSTIRRKYPNREIKIEISEDGENGCFIESMPVLEN